MAKKRKMSASEKSAKELANLGRYGDSVLVHMNPEEVRMMAAMNPGMTTNPQTGLPEAFLPFLAPLLAAGSAAAAPAAAAALPAAAAAIPAAASAALPAAASALPAAASAALPAAASALPSAAAALPAAAGAAIPAAAPTAGAALAPTLTAATPAAMVAPEVGAAALSPTLTGATAPGLTGGALGVPTAAEAAAPVAEVATQPVTELVKSQAADILTQPGAVGPRLDAAFGQFPGIGEPPLSPVDIPGSGGLPGAPLPGPTPGPGMVPPAPAEAMVPPAPAEALTGPGPGAFEAPGALPPLEPAPPTQATTPAEPGGLFSTQNLFDYGIPIFGGLLASGLFSPSDEEEKEEEQLPELKDPSPEDYTPVFPGADYVPGTDPEHLYYPNRRYFANGGMINPEVAPLMASNAQPTTPMGTYGIDDPMNPMGGQSAQNVTLNFQAGGPIPPMPEGIPAAGGMSPMPAPPPDPAMAGGMPPGPEMAAQMGGQAPDPKMVIDGAVAALQGQHPNPEAAIQMFLMIFGPEALEQLKMDVGAGGGRMIQGPGGPQDDMVPARINDTQEARLSDGEFVMTADAVRNIGNGDPMAGAQELSRINDMYSRQPTGALNIDRVR